MKQELRDIHLPDAVSWWPPAIGWWLLLAALIVSIALLIWRLSSRQPARPQPPINWRPLLQEELAEIQQHYAEHQQAQALAQALSTLLRKAVIKENPELAHGVAGQTGEAWLTTLDQHFDLDNEFSQQGPALLQAPYQPHVAFDADRLLALVCRAFEASCKESQTEQKQPQEHGHA